VPLPLPPPQLRPPPLPPRPAQPPAPSAPPLQGGPTSPAPSGCAPPRRWLAAPRCAGAPGSARSRGQARMSKPRAPWGPRPPLFENGVQSVRGRGGWSALFAQAATPGPCVARQTAARGGGEPRGNWRRPQGRARGRTGPVRLAMAESGGPQNRRPTADGEPPPRGALGRASRERGPAGEEDAAACAGRRAAGPAGGRVGACLPQAGPGAGGGPRRPSKDGLTWPSESAGVALQQLKAGGGGKRRSGRGGREAPWRSNDGPTTHALAGARRACGRSQAQGGPCAAALQASHSGAHFAPGRP
jgi:hypothetical protein